MAFIKYRGSTTTPAKPGSTTAANAPLTNLEIDGNFKSIADDLDTKAVSGAVGSSLLTMSTSRILGRTTAGSGSIEQISVGTGLSLSGGTLSINTSGTVDLSTSQTLSNKSLDDSSTYFTDNIDASKKLQFQLASISPSTTRVLTIPNVDGTVITSSDTGTVTNNMLAGSIANAKLSNSSVTIGSTVVSLGGSSTTLSGLTSTAFSGSTSGTVTLQAAAVAGTTTITLPATTGTVITSGDSGTVTNVMLAGSIANAKLSNSSVTIGSTAIALGGTSTTLSGLTSTAFSGSTSGTVTLQPAAVAGTTTITLPATTGTVITSGDSGTVTNAMLAGSIANAKLSNSSVTIGSTVIALGGSSTTLSGLTSVTSTNFVGNASTVTNGVYTTDTGTVTNTMLAGSIANAKLSNSSVTIGSTAIALGGTSTTLSGLTSVTSTNFVGSLSGNASSSTTSSECTGNSATVTNGVYTLGNQTIAGTKTFSSTISGSINGNAATVTNGVYTLGDQTIAGTKTFSSTISGSINGNAATVTNGVYTTDTGTVTNTMLAGSIANAKLSNSSVTIGSTAISLGSTATDISGLTSTAFSGSTSGTVTLQAAAVAGTTTITLPATTGTVITSGDSATVTTTMLTNSGVTAGAYNSVTVDAKGRVTGGTNPTTLTGYGITDAQPLDADLTAIAGLAGTTGFLKKTAADSWTLDTSTYITGNQNISVTGDVTGSGSTSISLSLINSGVTAGTYKSVTVDAKGRVTGGTNPTTLSGYGITDAQALDADLTAIAGLAGTTGFLKKTAADSWTLDTSTYITGNQSISVTGDATGSGSTSISLTLANSGATAGTYKSVTVDAKGRVTAGTNPTTLSGYGITDALPLAGGTMTGNIVGTYRIGIGTTTASYPLHVVGTGASTSRIVVESTSTANTAPGVFQFLRTSTSSRLISSVGQISFTDTATDSTTFGSIISAVGNNADKTQDIYYNAVTKHIWQSNGTETGRLETGGLTIRGNSINIGNATSGEKQLFLSNDSRTVYLYNNAAGTNAGLYDQTASINRWYTDVSGNFVAYGNVTAYSDIRLKTDLQQIPNALAKVEQLTGYTYTRTDTGERQTGLVAQEVEKVLPEAVLQGEQLSLAYGNMVGLLVEAVKELSARVKELEAK